MGLDFGSRTCGVALSDELFVTSHPLEIIRRDRANKLRKTLSRIEELCGQNDVKLIVLGLPLNMDDSAGFRAEDTLAFREDVERRTGLPVVMSDERLTTVEAYEIMDKMEIRREDRDRYVDMIAASIILREYMENHRGELEQMRNEKSLTRRRETAWPLSSEMTLRKAPTRASMPSWKTTTNSRQRFFSLATSWKRWGF